MGAPARRGRGRGSGLGYSVGPQKVWRGWEKMTVEYLLNQEMKHVLAALTPSNRLVCEVSLHTGLRVGDVLSLKTDSLARQFWITEAKTG